MDSNWFLIGPLVVAAVAMLGGVLALVRWMGRMDEWKVQVNEFMKDMRREVNTLLRRTSRAVETGSPLRLSEFGQQIARRINAESWAREVAPGLVDELEGAEPFQVDQFSRTYANSNAYDKTTDEWRSRFLACAYELGVDRSTVQDVLYVVLRDELLRRLGLPPAQS